MLSSIILRLFIKKVVTFQLQMFPEEIVKMMLKPRMKKNWKFSWYFQHLLPLKSKLSNLQCPRITHSQTNIMKRSPNEVITLEKKLRNYCTLRDQLSLLIRSIFNRHKEVIPNRYSPKIFKDSHSRHHGIEK